MSTFARFDTTEGSFLIRLFDAEAPNTVANFVGLAEGTKEYTDPRTGQRSASPFYDGIIFHRVIDGFMIQGGGYDADQKERKTRDPIKNESGKVLMEIPLTMGVVGVVLAPVWVAIGTIAALAGKYTIVVEKRD